ncbi:MAG: hypothetical protein MZV65_52500 [Chromatiales bacterium]|nr:hypothetical protein [Chromatiales bacterium]
MNEMSMQSLGVLALGRSPAARCRQPRPDASGPTVAVAPPDRDLRPRH